MRKEVAEVGWGDFRIIATGDPAVFAFRYDWRKDSVLFVHSLKDTPREVTFEVGLPKPVNQLLVNLLSAKHSRADRRGKHSLLIEAYGYCWYRYGPGAPTERCNSPRRE